MDIVISIFIMSSKYSRLFVHHRYVTKQVMKWNNVIKTNFICEQKCKRLFDVNPSVSTYKITHYIL